MARLPPPDELAWMGRAACQGADGRLFLTEGDADDMPPYPDPAAAAYCDRCPVRPECLQWAGQLDDVTGVWGGLSDYQRAQLARPRSRASCPGCGSRELVRRERWEACVCGLSWLTR